MARTSFGPNLRRRRPPPPSQPPSPIPGPLRLWLSLPGGVSLPREPLSRASGPWCQAEEGGAVQSGWEPVSLTPRPASCPTWRLCAHLPQAPSSGARWHGRSRSLGTSFAGGSIITRPRAWRGVGPLPAVLFSEQLLMHYCKARALVLRAALASPAPGSVRATLWSKEPFPGGFGSAERKPAACRQVGSLAGSPAHGETAAPAGCTEGQSRPGSRRQTDPGRGSAKSASHPTASFPGSGCADRAGLPGDPGVAGPCPALHTPSRGCSPTAQVEG